MLELAQTGLKPVYSQNFLPAVVDFADLSTYLELSGDSESFPCE
jgi:hypothetical protein